MQTDRPFVLSVAGYDPSGGAGVLADIKTFERLSVQGVAVLTAITLQTEKSFRKIQWLSAEQVITDIDEMFAQYPISCVKIGIVPNEVFLQKVVKAIRRSNPAVFIIWDTILKSSSGKEFFRLENASLLKETLEQINLITPNQPEFEFLQKVGAIGSPKMAIYQKGGHRTQKGEDILHTTQRQIKIAPNQLHCPPKHGSGCVLSSAIASYLARGYDLENACILAKIFIENFLNSHPSLLGNYHF